MAKKISLCYCFCKCFICYGKNVWWCQVYELWRNLGYILATKMLKPKGVTFFCGHWCHYKWALPSRPLSMLSDSGQWWLVTMEDFSIWTCVHAPFLRFSQVAIVLQWHLSAAKFPSFHAVVWLSGGWSLVGGWDGFLSMTGMIYLDLRYIGFFVHSFNRE